MFYESYCQKLKRAIWFSVIADEATDLVKQEQMTICISWVDENFDIHEDCLGLYQLDSTGSTYLLKSNN